jgi:hypothetical protein
MAHYLTCDDQGNAVKSYLLEMDGVETIESPASIDPGTKMAHAWIDITSIPVGSHTVRLRAKNDWGVGAYSSPLVFEKQLPGVPSGVGLHFE